MYLVEYLAKNQQLFVDNEISTEVLKTIKGDLLQLEEFKNLDKLIISDEGDFIHTKHRACNFNGTFILSKFMLTPTLYKLEDNVSNLYCNTSETISFGILVVVKTLVFF